jgi:tetratricopeptide (TPR) repeat protein
MANTAKVFSDARTAFTAGDLRRAEKLLRRVVQADGSDVAALDLLVAVLMTKGKSLTQLERHDEAFAAYDKALSINPQLTEALFQRARILDIEFQRARESAFDQRYDEAELAYRSFYKKYRAAQRISPERANIAAQKRAAFVGCARDCGPNVQAALANIANIASLFRQASFVLVENDSSDATGDLISRWCAQRPSARLVNLDGLSTSRPARTMRLAVARNAYLDIVRSEFETYDYLVVVDLDDASVTPFEPDEVLRALEYCQANSACAAVFPVQQYYYDWYALRQQTLCPEDIFEEAFDRACAQQCDPRVVAREFLGPKIFEIYDAVGSATQPMEVQSAFGGVGIYKMSSLIQNRRRYVGHKHKTLSAIAGHRLGFPEGAETVWQVCEHVEFHRGFLENGEKLFLLPWFRNADTGPLSQGYIETVVSSFINGKIFVLPDKGVAGPASAAAS